MVHRFPFAVSALLALSWPLAVMAQSPPTVRLDAGGPPALDVDVVGRRLDQARLSIQPSLGATRTDFGRAAIEILPQGDNAGLSQVLLRASGVVQDAFGNVFIRGDHRNVQYRINGVQLPRGWRGLPARCRRDLPIRSRC